MRAFGGVPSWRRIGIAVACLPPISSGSLIPSKRASLTANDALDAHARSRRAPADFWARDLPETSRNYPLHAHFRQERARGRWRGVHAIVVRKTGWSGVDAGHGPAQR